jgi:glucose-1-phosphate cytidylyltransferase
VTGTEGRRDWAVHLVDTGLETMTGGPIRRLAPWLGKDTFLMTYGDGLSDVNIPAVIELHRQHKKLATVTAVRPPSRFGGLTFDGDLVSSFVEKSPTGSSWINGGFFVLEPGVIEHIAGDDIPFESAPMERLTQARELVAYRHAGFWQCMDTLRDVAFLEELWQRGNPPWGGPP